MSARRARAAVALALAAAAAACGGGDAEARAAEPAALPPPVAVDPARRVALPALPAAAPEVGEGDRILSIGDEDGGGAAVFGEVADVAVRPSDGALVVLDRMEREVRVFSAAGKPLLRFGRRGRGPGEMESPAWVEVLPWSGELAVWDPGLRRLTVFSPQGRARRSSAVGGGTGLPAEPGTGWTVRRLRATRDGFVVERRALPSAGGTADRAHLLRLDTAATLADTLLTMAVAPGQVRTARGENARAIGGSGPRLLSPEPRWDVLPDGGVALAPGGPYALYLLDRAGAAERAVERPWPAAPVTRDDRLGCWEAVRREAAWSGYPMQSAEELDRAGGGRFAAARPAVTGVLAEGERVWVRRFDGGGHECGRSRTWDAYDRAGRPAGSVSLPPDFRPARMWNGAAYGVRRDSLGVWRVEVYPLSPASPKRAEGR